MLLLKNIIKRAVALSWVLTSLERTADKVHRIQLLHTRVPITLVTKTDSKDQQKVLNTTLIKKGLTSKWTT